MSVLTFVKSKFTIMLIIVLLVTVGQISTDIFLPSFNSMANEFHVSIKLIERTIVVFMVGFTIGTLVNGPLSDKYGRKKIVLISLGLGAASSFLCGFSPNIRFLWFVRFIQGFAVSACATLGRAISKDISANADEMAKLASINGVLYAVTISIAPVFGGYIESSYHNWRITFFILASYLLLLFCFMHEKMVETNLNRIHIDRKTYLTNYMEIFSNLKFLKYSSVSAFALAGEMAFLTIAPNLLQNIIKLSSKSFSYTIIIVGFALGMAGVINNFLVKIYGIDSVLRKTGVLMLCSSMFFVLFSMFNIINIYSVLLPVFFFLIGAGSCFSNGSSGSISLFKEKAGSAAAVYSCIQIIGGMLGSYFVTCFSHESSLGLALILLALSAFIVAIFLVAKKIHK